MRLSRFSDIALRALLYLGAHPQRLVPAEEIADRLAVSREHLAKCLQALSGLGSVQGVRGRGGGYRLCEDPERIRLGTLVRRTEPSLALAECFEEASACPLTGDCRLAGVLTEAQAAFFETMDRYSLSDLLAADASRLVRLEAARG